ncbi:helix-turn-helix domain-containing protein [Lentzea albidocapillata]|nr:helix-turn-helix transcriptional regulator [Lentzea albidocapillata]
MSDRITVISDAIAAAIRDYRKRQGMTREELAVELWDAGAPQAMSAAVVGYIETGRRDKDGARRREVTVDELALFARAMKTTVAELLGEHASMLGLDQAPPCPSCERRKHSGPVQDQVRADVELFDELEDFEPTLVEVAYALAREIDTGSEKLPSLTRELRHTLHELTSSRQRPPAEEDDLDDAGDPD